MQHLSTVSDVPIFDIGDCKVRCLSLIKAVDSISTLQPAHLLRSDQSPKRERGKKAFAARSGSGWSFLGL